MELEKDTRLETRSYCLPEGIDILADGILLDGGGATMVGANRSGTGIRLKGRRGVTIRNLNLLEYRHGVFAKDCEDLVIENVRISSTAETAHNTIFLDIFHAPGAYPGGICLLNTHNSRIEKCNLTHQMAGLLSYDCSALLVRACNASYSSGFGFHLSRTHDSCFEDNYADYCSRWQPRDGGSGHMGADAAGFVIVNGSSRNRFEGNFARLGGDGFFLAGLRHDGIFVPCNDNIFTGNDASWSPNISFEATFSSGNVFRENKANRSNYGFWLGFSRDNTVEGNEVHYNHQAGIAVENGIDMLVKGNSFTGNRRGILLWSKRIPKFDAAVPENDTSRGWRIEDNDFLANGLAVRIAADQDHGLRNYLENGRCPPPHGHRLSGNRFERNGVDIDAEEEYLRG